MDDYRNATVHCCADCGCVAGGGVSLKTCKSCMLVKYCNAKCQRNHWATHKKQCKQRAADLRDEALFKDPPPKEDCPICFLPMPVYLVCCVSLPPATITSVPTFDFANANKDLDFKSTEQYYTCCGKTLCRGCVHTLCKSGTIEKCPFCNSDHGGKTDKEGVEEMMKRVEANDAGSMSFLGSYYHLGGEGGLQQDSAKAMELWKQAAELGSSGAHCHLADFYRDKGDLKKAKFHYKAAAMAGNEAARFNIGTMEHNSGNLKRALKHWMIAASAGEYRSMHNLLVAFKQGMVGTDAIDATLTAYNNSCAEMRSEARDAAILYERTRPR